MAENQHRLIQGYRELTQEEIDLMNRIKAFGPELEKLCQDISEYNDGQYNKAVVEMGFHQMSTHDLSGLPLLCGEMKV